MPVACPCRAFTATFVAALKSLQGAALTGAQAKDVIQALVVNAEEAQPDDIPVMVKLHVPAELHFFRTHPYPLPAGATPSRPRLARAGGGGDAAPRGAAGRGPA